MSRAEESEPVVLGGRYRLLEALATGGMATVYLARQRGRAGFARTVAIKRMHPHFSEQHDFKALFIDEARLAARITHPNVVQTLDVVEDTAELFIVMEYVRGLPLSQLQKLADLGHGIPVDVACSIAVGALHGLHAAHEAKDEAGRPLGIVHRDVSPQNLLVGVDGVARLIDFGVAKAVSQLHTTREGELRGKLAYMAPEQIRGGVADRQTDVFSAAVVLWQTLAGRRLFVGNNDGELIYRLLEAQVVPPSTHRQGVPAELDRIVMKGLSRDRNVRYASALDMVHDLEESVAIASQRTVAAWVQDVGHEVLKERSAILNDLLGQASLHDDPDTLEALRISLTAPSVHGDGSKTPRLFPMATAASRPSSDDGTETVPLPRARVWAAAGLAVVLGAVALAFAAPAAPVVPRLTAGGARPAALARQSVARATPEPTPPPPPVVPPPKAAPRKAVKPAAIAPKPKPPAKGTSLYKRE